MNDGAHKQALAAARAVLAANITRFPEQRSDRRKALQDRVDELVARQENGT